MKVERTEHRISENIGTDEESLLKSVKPSANKEGVSGVAEKFARDSAEKSSSPVSKGRSELQHKVLVHEAKNEMSLLSQSKVAELTSKLGGIDQSKIEQTTEKFRIPEKSGSPYSEMTEILVPKSAKETHQIPDTRKNEVLMNGQLRAAQLHSQVESHHVTDHVVSEEKKTSFTDQMKEKAQQIGNKVSDAAKDLNEAGEKLKDVPLGASISKLSEKASDIAKSITDKPEILMDPNTKVQEEIHSVAEKGREIISRGTDEIKGRVNELLGKGVEKLEKARKDAAELDENMDPEKAVDKLKKEGDKYTITLGASGTPPIGVPVKGALKGTAELSKEKEGYKLTLDGEVAAALTKKKVGEVGLGSGAKVELTFKNEKEAKEAMRNLKQAVDVPDNPALAGGVKLNTNSLEKLGKHVKAVEVRGSGFAQGILSEVQPGKPDSVQLKTLFGKAQVKADESVRLEFDNGKPSKLVLKSSVEGNVTVGAGWKGDVAKIGITSGFENTKSGKVTVTTERELPLSPNADSKKIIEAMNSGDVSKLKEAAPEAFKKWTADRKYKLIISGDVRMDQAGTGAGVRGEIKLSVNADYFDKSRPALDRLVNEGPTPENIEALGDEAEAEGKVESYRYTGLKLTPGISVGESDAGVEIGYSKQEVIKAKSFNKMKTQYRQIPSDLL